MKNILITLLAIVIVFGLVFWCFKIGVKLNYKVWTEPMVRQTIQQMVKPECLK